MSDARTRDLSDDGIEVGGHSSPPLGPPVGHECATRLQEIRCIEGTSEAPEACIAHSMVGDGGQEFAVFDAFDAKTLGDGRAVENRTGKPRQARRKVRAKLVGILVSEQIMREAGGSPSPSFVARKRQGRCPAIHEDGDAVHVCHAILTGHHPRGRASIEECFEQSVHDEWRGRPGRAGIVNI